MTTEKKTLGQAIDEIVAALSSLDEKARATAIAAACAHLGLDRPESQPTSLPARVPISRAETGERVPPHAVDIRIITEFRII